MLENSDDISFKEKISEISHWNSMVAGDRKSLEYFYKAYFSDLYTFGTRIKVSPENTEDAIHELFLKVWNSRDRLPPVEYPRAYLFKSFRRILIDKVNEINRKRMFIFKEDYIDVNIQDLIISNESAQKQKIRLQIFLEKLPKRQKEIIYLRFYQNFSYHEIADILRINYQSVRNSIFTSLQTLRKKM